MAGAQPPLLAGDGSGSRLTPNMPSPTPPNLNPIWHTLQQQQQIIEGLMYREARMQHQLWDMQSRIDQLVMQSRSSAGPYPHQQALPTFNRHTRQESTFSTASSAAGASVSTRMTTPSTTDVTPREYQGFRKSESTNKYWSQPTDKQLLKELKDEHGWRLDRITCDENGPVVWHRVALIETVANDLVNHLHGCHPDLRGITLTNLRKQHRAEHDWLLKELETHFPEVRSSDSWIASRYFLKPLRKRKPLQSNAVASSSAASKKSKGGTKRKTTIDDPVSEEADDIDSDSSAAASSSKKPKTDSQQTANSNVGVVGTDKNKDKIKGETDK